MPVVREISVSCTFAIKQYSEYFSEATINSSNANYKRQINSNEINKKPFWLTAQIPKI